MSVNFKKEQVFDFLKEVLDPEVPVLSIVELGIVRDVNDSPEGVEVVITPTYTGCPAMKVIEDNILEKLSSKGIQQASVKTILTPPWTTDWISDEAKEKLRVYGIAPPEGSVDKSFLFEEPKSVTCPHCGSKETRMQSQFGSTACKALYVCQNCKEPFDYFKCL